MCSVGIYTVISHENIKTCSCFDPMWIDTCRSFNASLYYNCKYKYCAFIDE